jgi:signal transduction histidine kinase
VRWPIRYQVLAPFVAVTLGALGAVTLLDAYLAARRSERQIADQIAGLSRTLAEFRFPLTDAVLRQVRGLTGAEFVVADDRGDIIASSGGLRGWRPPAIDDAMPPTQDSGQLGPPQSTVVADVRYRHTVVTFQRRNDAAAPRMLHILYPEDRLVESRRAAAYPHLLVGGVVVLIAAAVSAVVAARLSRPIREVSRQVAGLAAGDFQPLDAPPRDDEVRDLVLAINTLTAQLDELRQAIRRGERLTLLGRLSGGLAHTLRNQVTGARMAVQLHQRRCRQDDAESLAVALRQLQLTEEHLRRFLAAGQPEEPRRADCNLDDWFGEVAALIEPASRHRKVALNCRANDAAGFRGDPDQLRQLLVNLALNAIEATSVGGWVRIEGEASAGQVIVRVTDNGPGPPAELVERLFEPFVTGKPEGVGLGLAVARQIAEAHGGRLSFQRRDGATCFELTFPAATPDAPLSEIAAVTPETSVHLTAPETVP